MKANKSIYRLSSVTLILFFLVILAGGIVRMSGSGMGCPDWPKCFGYTIPPTDVEPLTFREGKTFDKGQMIILNDTLWVAQEPLQATAEFNRSQWLKYPKHDYAVFNATHTWIEFLNRLATVVFAIPILLLLVLCYRHWKKEGDRTSFLLALGMLCAVLFVAWLGKLVVDKNLTTSSVTLHMMGSLVIVTLIVLLRFRTGVKRIAYPLPSNMKKLVWASLVLIVVQILLGTQVREEVDLIAGNGTPRSTWISQLPAMFYIHRSFSIALVLVILSLVYLNTKLKQPIRTIRAILGALFVEVFFGLFLAYGDFPASMQPLHLVYAIFLYSLIMLMVVAMHYPKFSTNETIEG
jgi:cytochrome c oxidase assembly protein subunit 15